MKRTGFLNNAGLHLGLYVLLLVLTPFLLLQNYLQHAIGKASEVSLPVGHFQIPVVLLLASFALLVLGLVFWKRLTPFRLVSMMLILLLLGLGQQSTDFYFGHKFYELQHNWHYLAYAILSLYAWIFFEEKGVSTSHRIGLIYITALSASTLDEGIQVFISSRIFDIGDIGKDGWGSLIGLTFILLIMEEGKSLKTNRQFWSKSIRKYKELPLPVFVFLFIFNFIFLNVGSLLSDTDYLVVSVLISISIFAVIFFLVHGMQWTRFRYAVLGLAMVLAIWQGTSISRNWDKGVVCHGKGNICFYRGIPLPYFDVMIFPQGNFRLVDKKIFFNKRDQNTLKKYASQIVIIGTGCRGEGGRGFPHDKPVQFIYNEFTGNALQILRLPSRDACQLYNVLRQEGKNPLLVVHQS